MVPRISGKKFLLHNEASYTPLLSDPQKMHGNPQTYGLYNILSRFIRLLSLRLWLTNGMVCLLKHQLVLLCHLLMPSEPIIRCLVTVIERNLSILSQQAYYKGIWNTQTMLVLILVHLRIRSLAQGNLLSYYSSRIRWI